MTHSRKPLVEMSAEEFQAASLGIPRSNLPPDPNQAMTNMLFERGLAFAEELIAEKRANAGRMEKRFEHCAELEIAALENPVKAD